MILNYRNYKNIDFKKYKRVFIFGCSFTNYYWPTWANIIGYEAPDAEIYNFGASGGGNLFISERVAASNQRYRFTDKDLILLMWSTFSREDRYIKTRWEIHGNIWTQGFYDKQFIEKYTCVKGYIVRDLGLMTLTKHALQNFPCDSIMLKSVDPDYDERYYDGEHPISEVVDLYRDFIYDMPMTLYDHQKTPEGGWINGHYYIWPECTGSSTKLHSDYHPNPKMYLNYLKKIGFQISDDTQNEISQITEDLMNIKNHKELMIWNNNLKSKNYHDTLHLI